MKPLLHAPKLAVFCSLFILVACKKDPAASSPTNPPVIRDTSRIPPPAPVANILPVADAGPDQVITLPTDSARLSGKGNDADGTIVSFHWFITTHDPQKGLYAFASSTAPEFTVKNLKEGIYDCTLTVTDNGGLSGVDRLVIRVTSSECPCYPDPCDTSGDPCDPWDY